SVVHRSAKANPMTQVAHTRSRPRSLPEPTWEVAHLFPIQGAWTEEEYFALNGNHLVEFSKGFIEVLPMPTTSHQLLVFRLCELLSTFVKGRDLGMSLTAPLRVRLWRRKFREPDIVFMLKEHAGRIGDEFWKGADLGMEVVSGRDEDRGRDLGIKSGEYARAGIAEYWIVDPDAKRITVLRLVGKRYDVHGEFLEGAMATSRLLPGFAVDVRVVFSQRLPIAATSKSSRKRDRSAAQ